MEKDKSDLTYMGNLKVAQQQTKLMEKKRSDLWLLHVGVGGGGELGKVVKRDKLSVVR